MTQSTRNAHSPLSLSLSLSSEWNTLQACSLSPEHLQKGSHTHTIQELLFHLLLLPLLLLLLLLRLLLRLLLQVSTNFPSISRTIESTRRCTWNPGFTSHRLFFSPPGRKEGRKEGIQQAKDPKKKKKKTPLNWNPCHHCSKEWGAGRRRRTNKRACQMDVATNHSPAKTSGTSRWRASTEAPKKRSETQGGSEGKEKASATTRQPKSAAWLASSSAKRGNRFIRQKYSFFFFFFFFFYLQKIAMEIVFTLGS